MNDVITTIFNHRSIRSYSKSPIKEDDLDKIIQASQHAPSSINGQHVSIIAIKDEVKKAKLAILAGNQSYIEEAPLFLIFCQDYYRAYLACQKNNVSLEIVNHLEATLVGAIDVGLSMMNAINVAESLGLGTVCIGGIRNQIEEVVRMLDLPSYVIPLCGLCIGYPEDKSELKPRLPHDAVYFEETYNPNLNKQIDQYDEEMANYMFQRTDGKSNRNWSEGIAQFYKNKSKRDIRKAMIGQGFKNE